MVQSNGPQSVFNVSQNPIDAFTGIHTMTPDIEIDESARKFMKVDGNCCWKFYERLVMV